MSTEKILSEFRKSELELEKLISSEEVPAWYTPQGYVMFKRKYAYGDDETVRQAFTRIAKTLAPYYSPDPELANEKFFS
ncbi:hypothetical protein, partial [Collinsella sp. Sow4_E3]|uniref:hypothetical protein n=1 Tax=Collinsella sp. Sow4_E3 TaxID=3438776 RepID=UPI003F93F32A